jgi:NADH dehydrogenase FAD-containing subunit
MAKTHEILILGANFGGIAVAHYLLNNTIPALTSLDSSKAYHVTLVGPSDSFLFKIALPRVIGNPDLIPLERAVVPFREGFSKHAASVFTFVQGLATATDASSRTVTVTLHDKSTKTLTYDSLVIATGMTSDPLWAVNDDLTATKAAHAEVHAALPKAKTILIGGGGPAGVETAGEIAEKYPSAKVTLLSGNTRVLPKLKAGTSSRAESQLRKLGVELINDNIRVVSSHRSTDTGKTTVNISDGSVREVDLYIAATGGRPNTSFLPTDWLDASRRLAVDSKTLRATAPSARGVYGVGDAASYSAGTVIDCQNGIHPVCTSLGHDLALALADAAAVNSKAALKERKYKPFSDTQMVPIGRHSGVGQVLGWRVPSLMVWLVKGRTFFIEKARPHALGLDYIKP